MPPASLSSTLSIRDDGVNVANTSAEGVVCAIGSCSSGVAGTTYVYRGTDTGAVIDELGTGPLVDYVIEHLIRSEGKTVYAHKATASTAGSTSAVTQTGSGPAVSVSSGTPVDSYNYKVLITAGGALGTSTFQYSEDGGDTYSDEIATAATYAFPSGVTMAFAAGTYVVDTTYEWTDTGPRTTTTNVGDAIDDIIASGIQIEAIHLVGQAANAADAETMATTLGTKLDAAHAAHKYWWGSMELPAVDQALLIAGFDDFAYRWLVCVGGFCELIQQRNAQIQKRSAGRVIIPRVVRNPLSVQPMRAANDSNLEPISGIDALVPAGAVAADGYHDENATPGFDAARIASLRKFDGLAGIYISHVPMMSLSTSPIQTVPDARVILAAAQAYYAWSLTNLGKRLRRDATTGYILPAVADALERAATGTLQTAIGPHVDGIAVLVNREDDLSSDPTLRATIRLVKAGYVFEVDSEIGFVSTLPVAA